MNLEWWADLVTVVVGVLALAPLLGYVRSRLRRLGAWAGALRSDRASLFRSIDSEPGSRLYWVTRSVVGRAVLKFLSCLANPRWGKPTLWEGRGADDAYVQALNEEAEELGDVQKELARAHARMAERWRRKQLRKQHRGVVCSFCRKRCGSDFACYVGEFVCPYPDDATGNLHACGQCGGTAAFNDQGEASPVEPSPT